MIDTSTVFGKVSEYTLYFKYLIGNIGIEQYIFYFVNLKQNYTFVSDFHTVVCYSTVPVECRDVVCFSLYDGCNNNRKIPRSMSTNIL